MKLGVIGLPNVGKSTLFNAITQAGAQAANYPFCTIEPNVGVVAVPDKRLDVLAEMYRPEKYTPPTIEFVDIAGLVRVDAVVHVVRCFEDGNVVHVDGSIDPVRDAETVNLELIFADMDTLQKRIDKNARLAKADKKVAAEVELLKRLYEHLESGQPARTFEADKEEREIIHGCFLLTDKPVIYVANIAEDDIGNDDNPYVKALYGVAEKEGAGCLTVCARIEEEIAELEPAEKQEYLQELGIEESGLDKLIATCYDLLGLMSFLTAGPKEVRAWTIQKGTKAPQAAGKIHTDFERGFIRAEVVNFDDLVANGTMQACKDKGLIRSEGKDYVMRDGDVVVFRFNV